MLYLGVLIRGLDNGGTAGLAAVLLALTALCHLIPAIFMAVATVVIVVAHWPGVARLRWLATRCRSAVCWPRSGCCHSGAAAAYLNDMGWETLPAAAAKEGVWDFLFPKPLYAITALALVGVVLSFVFLVRTGIFLTVVAAVFGAMFIVWPADGDGCGTPGCCRSGSCACSCWPVSVSPRSAAP